MKEKFYGIIGKPLSHSLSPDLHNYWFKKYKIPANYSLIEIESNEIEKVIEKIGLPKKYIEFNKIKSMGFSDKKLSELTKISEKLVRKKRISLKIIPVFKKVDTCAAEFKSFTPYMYSTYQKNLSIKTECEANPSIKRKIIILGGGPNRIG